MRQNGKRLRSQIAECKVERQKEIANEIAARIGEIALQEEFMSKIFCYYAAHDLS